MGICTVTPMKLLEVELFPTEKIALLEWLQCCGSILCYRSHKHRLLPFNRSSSGQSGRMCSRRWHALARLITFHLAIYVKANEIQWRLQTEFEDIVIRMGGFHIAMNYLAVLGKKYHMSLKHRVSSDRILYTWQFDNLDPSEREVVKSWSEGPQYSHGSHVSSAVACLHAVALQSGGQ